MSQGYNTATTFDDGLTYSGGGRDWLGFDDGTRGLPAAIPDTRVVRSSRFRSTGFSPAELETMGESFSNIWSPEAGRMGQNQSYSLVAGNSWNRLGAIVSVTWSENHQNQREDRTFHAVSGGDLEVQNDYDFDITTSKTSTGVVGNLAYKFSGNHRVALENFYTHSSKNEARIFEGYNNDVGEDIRNTRLLWVEEDISPRSSPESTCSRPRLRPAGLERQPLARQPGRTRPARDALRVQPFHQLLRAGGRVAERLPHVQRPRRRGGRIRTRLEFVLHPVGRAAGDAQDRPPN